MLYVYTQLPSSSARLLAATIEGKRIRRHKRLKGGDIVINWGSRDIAWASDQGALVLNSNLLGSKRLEIFALAKKGLPTPPLSEKPGEEWLGRSDHHSHGTDFLRGVKRPSFWVKRLPIVEEYRIHTFNYDGDGDIRILRWGKKVPRGPEAHEWVRSDLGGWRISYNLPSESLPSGLRTLAKKALSALSYDWGAVDVGLTNNGKQVIFEVNSAPGLDEGGQTINRYAAALEHRIKGLGL